MAKTKTKAADAAAAPKKSAGRKPAPKKATASESAAASSDSRPNKALPLFYDDPHPLSAERHAGKSLARTAGYGFARNTSVLPLNLVEFGVAARSYPIVFTLDDVPAALSIVGLRQGRNLFVAESGEWALNHYVPAYARRYPFIFMTHREREQFVLCVDEGSGLVVDGGDQPFFADGKATEVTESAMRFCSAYQSQYENTRAFAVALVENDLLEPHRIELKLGSGEPIALGGFRVVVEAKVRELPDETFLEFRKRGWLPALYHSIQSGSNWSSLVNLEDRAGPTA